MEFTAYFQPRTITGPDGLPHCASCTSDECCPYHKKQVRLALGMLRTDTLLQGARDLRFLISSRSSFGD